MMPGKMSPQTKKRSKDLSDRGFKYNGTEYEYTSGKFYACFHWIDIMTYDESKWNKCMKEFDARLAREEA